MIGPTLQLWITSMQSLEQIYALVSAMSLGLYPTLNGQPCGDPIGKILFCHTQV